MLADRPVGLMTSSGFSLARGSRQNRRFRTTTICRRRFTEQRRGVSSHADKLYAPIREYIDQYWRPLASIALLILSALAGLEKAGVSPTTLFGNSASVKPWVFLGCFITLLIFIRFRRVAYWVHRILFPRPELPPDPPHIFRGPESFGIKDQERLPGRKGDRDVCLQKIIEYPFFYLEGESGCGKSSLLQAAVLPALSNQYRVVPCRVASDPFGKVSAAVRDEQYRVKRKPAWQKGPASWP